MSRALAVLGVVALALGCRTPESNPLAAFGAATIPPPTIEMPADGSYYNAPGSAAGQVTVPPTNALPSISVPSGGAITPTPATPQPSIPRPYAFGSLAPGGSSAPSFTTDPADREPIRVVETTPGEARIATAPPRATTTPGVVDAAPQEREPIRAFGTTPTNRSIPPYVPAFGQPPASGFKSSGSFRTDGRVQPAAYQQAVPSFTEASSTIGGQWRPR